MSISNKDKSDFELFEQFLREQEQLIADRLEEENQMELFADEVQPVTPAIECPVVASRKRSQGYTDAIHETLQAVKDKLVAANPPPAPVDPIDLPYQFTFEQWQRHGTEYGTPTPNEPEASRCFHDWKFYQGLNFDDYYCTKCGTTRPLDPSR